MKPILLLIAGLLLGAVHAWLVLAFGLADHLRVYLAVSAVVLWGVAVISAWHWGVATFLGIVVFYVPLLALGLPFSPTTLLGRSFYAVTLWLLVSTVCGALLGVISRIIRKRWRDPKAENVN